MLITEGDISNCPYRVVGLVEGNVHGSFFRKPKQATLVDEIRQRAMKFSADAVVHAEIGAEHSTVVWGRAKGVGGKAIKFVEACPTPRLVARR